MSAIGNKILASEGQTVQNKINSIVNLWGGTHPGTQNVSAETVMTAAQINNWKAYLRTLSSRITGNSATIGIPANSTAGNNALWSEISALYSSADKIYSWCNRSECNTSECNRSENNSSSENDGGSERNSGER